MTAMRLAFYRNVAEKLENLSYQVLRENEAERDVAGRLKLLADTIRSDMQTSGDGQNCPSCSFEKVSARG
jgi:hypothetical protein